MTSGAIHHSNKMDQELQPRSTALHTASRRSIVAKALSRSGSQEAHVKRGRSAPGTGWGRYIFVQFQNSRLHLFLWMFCPNLIPPWAFNPKMCIWFPQISPEPLSPTFQFIFLPRKFKVYQNYLRTHIKKICLLTSILHSLISIIYT